MPLYQLQAGLHVQDEDVVDAKGKPVKDEEGNVKREPKTYKAGQTFTSDSLTVRKDTNKFKMVGGDDGGMRAAAAPGLAPGSEPTTNPHGQVTSGFQRAVGAEVPGPVRSGPITPEELEARGIAGLDEEADRQVREKVREARRTNEADARKAGRAAEAGGGEEEATAKDQGRYASYSRDDLEGKKKEELQQLAEDNEIELHGAKTKAEMIDAIVKAR